MAIPSITCLIIPKLVIIWLLQPNHYFGLHIKLILLSSLHEIILFNVNN